MLPVLACANALALLPQAALACASCGCTLSADAAMGYSVSAGWDLSVEYDYIHQDQLRSGTHAVSAVPDGDELERETLSRYVTTGLSFSPNTQWNFKLLVPYVSRTHSTFGEYDSTQPLPGAEQLAQLEHWRHPPASPAIRVSCPPVTSACSWGSSCRPGAYGTAVEFYAGPAAGTPLDASLQPGHWQHRCDPWCVLLSAHQPELRFLRERAVPERGRTSHGPAGQ